MYDVNYFIEKFEAIPEEYWCIGSFGNGGIHCAFGHCGMRSYTDILSDVAEADALNKISNDIVDVNDGYSQKYKGQYPKERILSLLYDIRDKELSEANVNATRELINNKELQNQ